MLIGREMAAALAAMQGSEDLNGPDGPVTPACFPDSSDASLAQAADFLRKKMRRGDALLIKGSRGMALERLTALLTGDGGHNG